jgi:hypothetical protein
MAGVSSLAGGNLMLNVRIQAPAFVVENGDVIRDAKQRS